MLRNMALTRAFDERMYRAQRQGKTSFYMKSTGEEAVAVAAAEALDRDDMCFPSYRQQGLLIVRGWPLVDMMNQIYSNKADRLKGRQLPVLYSAKERSEEHTSELQSLMRISYAAFCLKKTTIQQKHTQQK